jgi:GDP-L-fucose synthase
MYKNKKVLVAGGTGTIGIPLVKKLIERRAHVTVVSLDSPEYAGSLFQKRVCFMRRDLTDLRNCVEATEGMDYVFNLVGIKGSTGIGEKKVASYLVPMLWFQTNLMEAAFRNKVKGYLFVSSICGYPQMSIAKKEDRMWEGLPKQNDRIPGLAKRIGEIQGEAYLLEHDWKAVKIIRPSNVYGPFDDFDPRTAQVVPALIRRMLDGEDPLTVWGDGSAVRDFIYADDAAYWMLVAMEIAPACLPINLGSGKGTTIKELVRVISRCTSFSNKIVWDKQRPAGDPVRVLSVQRARRVLGYRTITSLEEGLRKTVAWYKNNKGFVRLKKGKIS